MLWQCLTTQLMRSYKDSGKALSHTCIKIIARYAHPLSQSQNFSLVMTSKLTSLTSGSQTRLGPLQVNLLLQGKQATRVAGPSRTSFFWASALVQPADELQTSKQLETPLQPKDELPTTSQ